MHIFSFFCRYFSWVQTYFDVDVARCKCSTDMVDGALAIMDLTLSKRDMIGFAPPVSRANGRSFWAIFFENFQILNFWNVEILDFWHFPSVQTGLDGDVERCGCGIDMVDGALGTLDLTLSKHDMIRFAPRVFHTEETRKIHLLLSFFKFQKNNHAWGCGNFADIHFQDLKTRKFC